MPGQTEIFVMLTTDDVTGEIKLVQPEAKSVQTGLSDDDYKRLFEMRKYLRQIEAEHFNIISKKKGHWELAAQLIEQDTREVLVRAEDYSEGVA